MESNRQNNIIRRLVDRRVRWEYTKKQLVEDGDFKYIGLTNKSIGPPVTLNKSSADSWNKLINDCLIKCVSSILVPAQAKDIVEDIECFEKVKEDKQVELGGEKFSRQVSLGIDRVRKKWRKRGYEVGCQVGSVGMSLGELYLADIGKLKRGELEERGEVELSLDNRLDKNKDLYKVLAFSIYGRSKFRKLIFRSLDKYLKMYEERERVNFRPHWGALCNGEQKWINSWYMLCALIYNRDLCFSVYELSIISSLYDVNINIYVISDNNDFRCIWKTSRKSNRVINILSSLDNNWSLLVGRRKLNQSKESLHQSHLLINKHKEGKLISNLLENEADSLLGARYEKDNNQVASYSVSKNHFHNNYTYSNKKWSIVSSEPSSQDSISVFNTKDSPIEGEKYNKLKSNMNSKDIVLNQQEEWSIIDSVDRNDLELNQSLENKNILNSKIMREVRCASDSDWSIITVDTVSKIELDVIKNKVSKYLDNEVNIHTGLSSGRKDSEFSQISQYTSSLDSVKSLSDKIIKSQDYNNKEYSSIGDSLSTITNDSNKVGFINDKYEKGKDSGNIDIKNHNSLLVGISGESQESGSSLSSLRSLMNREGAGEENNKLHRIKDIRPPTNKSVPANILYNAQTYRSNEIEEERLDIVNINTHNQNNIEQDDNSISTTSSIAALFVDTELENTQLAEGRNNKHRKARSNNITRREVWSRWKNLVRGKHKRQIRNRKKVERKQNRETQNSKLIFDYTTNALSEAETSLLGKGETFCVVNYKVDEDMSKVDLYKYQRRLRLHEYFRDPINIEQDTNMTRASQCTLCRRRSTTQTPTRARRSVMSNITDTPNTVRTRKSVDPKTHTHMEDRNRRLPSTYDPESINRNLNRYNNCIQEEILVILQNTNIPLRDNISNIERIALKTLKERIKNKEIIITKADKGSGLVAVDYDTYITKGTSYIEQEAKAYTKTEEEERDIVDKLVKTRNKLVDQLKDNHVIPPQTALYIKKQLEEKVTGIKFYYKIHKDTNIHTMPLRPLQSCIKAPTHHLSIVLTDILQPLLKTENIPTFISDSNQLLFRLHKLGKIPLDCTLISSDVSALYPSIPHREGFKAMNMFLKDKTMFSEAQIISILKALELVITENYIRWNRHMYKQTSGVAMGTPVAVAYANIFMHWVDNTIKKKATYIHEHIRYIDDNLFILPTQKIEDLIQIANNILPPHIKFTYEKLDKQSQKGLPFLDTQLTIAEDSTIQSRLYTKATDRHAYLLPASYHPPHITHNIPAAVFGRIRKICSKEDWFLEDAHKARTWLLDRGYKKVDIDQAFDKTQNKDRWTMIQQIEEKRTKQAARTTESIFQIPLIMTYNQHNNDIKKVLKRRQPLLNNAFSKTNVRPRLSYRRQGNLNNILIQKSLRGPIETGEKGENVFTQCKEAPPYRTKCPCKGSHRQDRCRCCMHNNPRIEDWELRIHKPVNCNSKNIIYVIGCRKCTKKYVGETQQRLKDRLAQHMYNMNKLNQPLYLHFRYTHKLEHLYIAIAETVKSTEPFYRKVREAWWINHLQTLEPRGNQIYTGE